MEGKEKKKQKTNILRDIENSVHKLEISYILSFDPNYGIVVRGIEKSGYIKIFLSHLRHSYKLSEFCDSIRRRIWPRNWSSGSTGNPLRNMTSTAPSQDWMNGILSKFDGADTRLLCINELVVKQIKNDEITLSRAVNSICIV